MAQKMEGCKMMKEKMFRYGCSEKLGMETCSRSRMFAKGSVKKTFAALLLAGTIFASAPKVCLAQERNVSVENQVLVEKKTKKEEVVGMQTTYKDATNVLRGIKYGNEDAEALKNVLKYWELKLDKNGKDELKKKIDEEVKDEEDKRRLKEIADKAETIENFKGKGIKEKDSQLLTNMAYRIKMESEVGKVLEE
ncbi:MAG: hypothetical protein ACP5KJ_01785, partial [Candidatus Micrarchaeia archaeon]